MGWIFSSNMEVQVTNNSPHTKDRKEKGTFSNDPQSKSNKRKNKRKNIIHIRKDTKPKNRNKIKTIELREKSINIFNEGQQQ